MKKIRKTYHLRTREGQWSYSLTAYNGPRRARFTAQSWWGKREIARSKAKNHMESWRPIAWE